MLVGRHSLLSLLLYVGVGAAVGAGAGVLGLDGAGLEGVGVDDGFGDAPAVSLSLVLIGGAGLTVYGTRKGPNSASRPRFVSR